jgi:hypothetical protein
MDARRFLSESKMRVVPQRIPERRGVREALAGLHFTVIGFS